MALHATCYTDLKRYGHHVILRSEKNKASYQVPSISGYAADTALDLMAVTDENERLVEVHITKDDILSSRALPACGIENAAGGLLNCREPAPAP